MRVLQLTPELPYAPGGSGGSTRQFQLLRRLRVLGHDVTVVAPVHPSQLEGAELLRGAGVTLHGGPRPASRAREVLAAVRRRPGLVPALAREPLLAWQVDVFWTALRPLALRALQERPDVVLVEHDWAAAWAGALPAGTPRALTLHNLSWRYYEARARAAGGGPEAAGLRLEGRRFERFDRRRLRAYDLLVTMSEDDDAAVRSVSDTPSVVVPNGVDTSALHPGPPIADPVAIFTGTLAYPPNAEALLWLLGELWPRVVAEVPGARLLVVGRDAPEEARRLAGADDTVTLAGWVPDMQPWFDRASVVLVPMRSGGGTRLKVLDGLAGGRAMVTTAAGAEGIDLRDGEHALVADGADAFTAATVRLLRDADLRARLGAAARRLAEEHYDWAALGDRLERALVALAGTGASSARS
jgi:glycosyltransferase involved in cell wall biosynthesis